MNILIFILKSLVKMILTYVVIIALLILVVYVLTMPMFPDYKSRKIISDAKIEWSYNLCKDSKGNLYYTSYEYACVTMRTPEGSCEKIYTALGEYPLGYMFLDKEENLYVSTYYSVIKISNPSSCNREIKQIPVYKYLDFEIDGPFVLDKHGNFHFVVSLEDPDFPSFSVYSNFIVCLRKTRNGYDYNHLENIKIKIFDTSGVGADIADAHDSSAGTTLAYDRKTDRIFYMSMTDIVKTILNPGEFNNNYKYDLNWVSSDYSSTDAVRIFGYSYGYLSNTNAGDFYSNSDKKLLINFDCGKITIFWFDSGNSADLFMKQYNADLEPVDGTNDQKINVSSSLPDIETLYTDYVHSVLLKNDEFISLSYEEHEDGSGYDFQYTHVTKFKNGEFGKPRCILITNDEEISAVVQVGNKTFISYTTCNIILMVKNNEFKRIETGVYGNITSMAVDNNGHIFMGGDRYIYSYKITKDGIDIGSERWIKPGYGNITSLAISDGTLYFIDNSSRELVKVKYGKWYDFDDSKVEVTTKFEGYYFNQVVTTSSGDLILTGDVDNTLYWSDGHELSTLAPVDDVTGGIALFDNDLIYVSQKSQRLMSYKKSTSLDFGFEAIGSNINSDVGYANTVRYGFTMRNNLSVNGNKLLVGESWDTSSDGYSGMRVIEFQF